ncbi:peptidase S8/S53 domain-containing protein [Rhizophagus diaphanus]|nr:peptidase S8/S53 domain-containing protein [Rhizophagus diaphanus] [Rhizophagus sp. MUCL 43196]
MIVSIPADYDLLYIVYHFRPLIQLSLLFILITFVSWYFQLIIMEVLPVISSSKHIMIKLKAQTIPQRQIDFINNHPDENIFRFDNINNLKNEKRSYIVIIKPKNNAVSTNIDNTNSQTISSIIQDDDLYQSHLSWITSSQQTGDNEIIHEFAIRGYVGLFEPKFVDEILSKENDVELIVPDREVQVTYDLRGDNDNFSCSLEKKIGTKKQGNPTWVIELTSVDCLIHVPSYRRHGINTNHTDFEGRASWGITVRKNASDVDEYGNVHGVAKLARVIAVKVLGKEGRGARSDVITGLNWVAQQHKVDSRKRTIDNLSLIGKYFPLANAAIRDLIDLGIHVTIAAGNYFGENSCYSSPASTPEVINQH